MWFQIVLCVSLRVARSSAAPAVKSFAPTRAAWKPRTTWCSTASPTCVWLVETAAWPEPTCSERSGAACWMSSSSKVIPRRGAFAGLHASYRCNFTGGNRIYLLFLFLSQVWSTRRRPAVTLSSTLLAWSAPSTMTSAAPTWPSAPTLRCTGSSRWWTPSWPPHRGEQTLRGDVKKKIH